MSPGGTIDVDSLWDFFDPAASEERFRSLLPAASEAGPLFEAELLTQLARSQGLQRRFDEAHQTLDQAQSALASSGVSADAKDRRRVEVRLLLERGRVFNSSGDPRAAAPLFRGALDLGKAAPDRHTVDAAHMLAIVANGSAVRSWNLEAIELARQSADPKAKDWLGSLHNNLGWTYHDSGDYATALVHFRTALDFFTRHARARQVQIAQWTVARCLRSLRRFDEALAIQLALERECAKANHPDPYVFEELAECFAARDQPDLAARYASSALAHCGDASEFLRGEPVRHQRLVTLASAESRD